MATFFEFFAGGGMARAGLGPHWTCLCSNDFDPVKASIYAANWGNANLLECDVAKVEPADLPGQADLAWASFPCQDLSLAGAGAGLSGERSGAFWPFWNLMKSLSRERRAPRLIVLENVLGALSSHDGKDFAAIGTAMAKADYRLGAIVINALGFVPQSRPRLFVVGIHASMVLDQSLTTTDPNAEWCPPALIDAYNKLPASVRRAWVWWKLPRPQKRTTTFADLVEDEPVGVTWHLPKETQQLLDMMSPLNRAKVESVAKAGKRVVGTIYKRTRMDEASGMKVQRAEIRFDDVAGCLRTPAGGSSRQVIMVVDGKNIRSRLLSPREAARLMGLPDSYLLPKNYNAAYHLAGDGVAVPVVRHLAEHLLEPLLGAFPKTRAA